MKQARKKKYPMKNHTYVLILQKKKKDLLKLFRAGIENVQLRRKNERDSERMREKNVHNLPFLYKNVNDEELYE